MNKVSLFWRLRRFWKILIGVMHANHESKLKEHDSGAGSFWTVDLEMAGGNCLFPPISCFVRAKSFSRNIFPLVTFSITFRWKMVACIWDSDRPGVFFSYHLAGT
jgi:hypothetical protein